MEIEVGEYVRTRAGHFYKITRIDENGLIYWNKIQCGWNIEQLKDIVAKHSKNIIDLVEVGDYVNGYKVISIDYDVIDDKTECIELDLNNNYQYNFISARQIKTILTKEQFSSIEYKVEESK